MSDPNRWLDDAGGATSDEKELLRSGREAKMPSELRKRVWLGIAAGAASMGAAAATSGAAAASASAAGDGAAAAAGGALQNGLAAKGVWSVLAGKAAKGVVAIALLGGAGAGVATLRSRPAALSGSGVVHTAPMGEGATQAPAKPVDHHDVAPNIGDVAPVVGNIAPVLGDVAPMPKQRTGAARSGAHAAPAIRANDGDSRLADTPSDPPPTSRLREESAAVLAIRKALVAGDAPQALRMLDRARTEFPGGALVQEREALTVRALVESGQKEAARARGEAFLRAFPRSPHAAEVRALVGP